MGAWTRLPGNLPVLLFSRWLVLHEALDSRDRLFTEQQGNVVCPFNWDQLGRGTCLRKLLRLAERNISVSRPMNYQHGNSYVGRWGRWQVRELLHIIAVSGAVEGIAHQRLKKWDRLRPTRYAAAQPYQEIENGITEQKVVKEALEHTLDWWKSTVYGFFGVPLGTCGNHHHSSATLRKTERELHRRGATSRKSNDPDLRDIQPRQCARKQVCLSLWRVAAAQGCAAVAGARERQ